MQSRSWNQRLQPPAEPARLLGAHERRAINSFCHIHIRLRPNGCHIVQNDRLSKPALSAKRTLSGTTVSENLSAEVFSRLCGDLTGEVEASVVHRQQHAFDGKLGVHAPLNQMHRIEEL